MFKLIAVAAALSATAASAASYDVVTGFAIAGSPFSFGTDSGPSFTPLPGYAPDNCVGFAGLACFNTPGADYTFPAVGKNISGSDPLTFATNVLPKDMLFVQSNPGATATVRFTAPFASTYTLAGSFTRIDTSNGSGDGVFFGINAPQFGGGGALGKTYLDTQAFTLIRQFAAGETADFTVYAQVDTFNDGTGFQLSVTNVPEPASWGMLLAGFALTGLAARRRRVVAA